MLGDKNSQRQQQHVNLNEGQEAKIEVPCDFYTNDAIADLELKRNSLGYSVVAAMDSDIRKARTVILLQYQGHVTRVLCSLLDQESSNCQSTRNSGKRCYLLGPKSHNAGPPPQVHRTGGY